MTQELFFTVIVSAYNHERFIADAVRSVLTQTVPVDRIIFFSDGSKDQTLAAARRLWADDPRVEYLDDLDRNFGLVARLKQAFARIQKGYVILVSADDIIDTRAIEVHRSLLARTGREWSVGAVEMTDMELVPTARFAHDVQHERIPHAVYRSILQMDPFFPQGYCVAASLYHRVGGHDSARLVDDYPLYLNMAWEAEPAISTELVASYRKLAGSFTDDRNEDMWLDCARVAFGEFRRAPLPALAACSRWMISAALAAAVRGHRLRALQHYLLGAILWPGPATFSRTVWAWRRFWQRRVMRAAS